ncbi:MAG TPA: hypothetical protein VMP38_09105, partial [Candidatus Acidoferrum sp.]|nr:hypothetical protein [Candidatus Acidoferrum sp.]
MIPRFILAVLLAVVMVVVGITSFIYLGTRTSKVAVPAQKPTVVAPRAQALVLPGTLYIAQSGAIYSLSAGRFHQRSAEAGYSQPSLMPDGSLLVVKMSGYFSDVYVLSRFGTPLRQLTNNKYRFGMADPSLN